MSRPPLFGGPIWPYRPTLKNVEIDDIYIRFFLVDERILMIPIKHFVFLEQAPPAQRQNWQILQEGEAVWWDEIDEGVEIAHILGQDIA